jgi:uncharacterized phage protein (TIGR02216 family)
MAFGLGRLRLSPDAFWRMTPRECAAAWRGFHGDTAGPPGRLALSELMRAFPDSGEGLGDGQDH